MRKIAETKRKPPERELSTTPVPWSPWGLGSEAWPLNLHDMESMQDRLHTLRLWKEEQDKVVGPSVPLHNGTQIKESVAGCASLYGVGVCKEQLSELELARFKSLHAQLEQLARFDYLCKGAVPANYLLPRLPVVQIELAGDAIEKPFRSYMVASGFTIKNI